MRIEDEEWYGDFLDWEADRGENYLLLNEDNDESD